MPSGSYVELDSVTEESLQEFIVWIVSNVQISDDDFKGISSVLFST